MAADGDLRQTILDAPHHTRLLGEAGGQHDWHRERVQRLDQETLDRELAIHRASPDLVATADIDGFLLSLNDAGHALLGLAAGTDLQRLRLPELFDADSARAFAETALPRAVAEHVCHSEAVLRAATGEAIPCSQILIAHRDAAGNVAFFSLILRDIRPLRQAEQERRELLEQLHHAQKMDTVGRLASGIAHDFSNILTVIIGYTELSLERLPPGALHEDLDMVLNAAQRAARLSRQLLDISVKRPAQPSLLDLNEVVEDASRLLKCLLGKEVELRIAAAPELHLVRMDRSQLEQVLLNLAVNARDAMPEGGRLEIQTANLSLDALEAAQLGLAAAGDYVRLSVADSGSGMEPEVMERLFAPFYTTKQQGRGSGIGLASVHGIVRRHQGSICVNSGKGRGAIFDIHLPRALLDGALVSPAAAAPEPEPEPQEGNERILLVEDNAEIRELLSRALGKRGYRLTLAQDGVEAFRLYRQQTNFDLVISDLAMPRMSGRQLCAELRELDQAQRLLLISGHAEQAEGAVADDGIHLLAKPFPLQTLLNKVRDILDPPAS